MSFDKLGSTVAALRDTYTALRQSVDEHSDSVAILLRASIIQQEKERERVAQRDELNNWRDRRKPLPKPRDKKR